MLTVPANLAAGIGSMRPQWISALPSAIDDAAARWSLSIGEPFQPGGYTSWVAPVIAPDGTDAVLKITAPETETRDEPLLLRHLEGHGAVRLLDHYDAGDSSVLLLERLRPGLCLGDVLPEAECDPIVAAILKTLWDMTVDEIPLRPLSDMTSFWAGEYRAAPTAGLDPELARLGIDLFESLPLSSPDRTVLGTDVHQENILSSGSRWVLIDPKPYVGDRNYDLTQYLVNCARLHTDPLALVGRMAALCDLDAAALRLWTFARCVQESAEFPELIPVCADLAP